MSRLLIDETPIVVLPSLVKALGMNPAVMLQQIHHWLEVSPYTYEGAKWMFHTDAQWSEKLGFMSAKTIQRTRESLKEKGLIRVEKLAGEFGGNSFDRKNYFTINYEAVDQLDLNLRKSAFGQNDQIDLVKDEKPSNSVSSQNDQIDKVTQSQSTSDASGQSDQIESDNLTNPSSHSDQFRTSQNDQIRSSQNDQLLEEVNKRVIEGDGEEVISAPNANEHPVFSNVPDLISASDLKSQDRFQMHFQWEPSITIGDRCKSQGVVMDLLSHEEQQNLLGEFRSYWEGRVENLNQSAWEHKLVQRIKHVVLLKQSAQVEETSGRKAVTAATMNIRDTDW